MTDWFLLTYFGVINSIFVCDGRKKGRWASIAGGLEGATYMCYICIRGCWIFWLQIFCCALWNFARFNSTCLLTRNQCLVLEWIWKKVSSRRHSSFLTPASRVNPRCKCGLNLTRSKQQFKYCCVRSILSFSISLIPNLAYCSEIPALLLIFVRTTSTRRAFLKHHLTNAKLGSFLTLSYLGKFTCQQPYVEKCRNGKRWLYVFLAYYHQV